jgi:hypothetical protein
MSEVAALLTFAGTLCRSGVVKGCKMPAPSRRPVKPRTNSTGRRLTSLKGGNRGRKPRSHGKQSPYGDLSSDFSVKYRKVTHHQYSNVPCQVSCITMAPVFSLTVSAKEHILMPSTERSYYRCWPIVADSVQWRIADGDSHDSPTFTGGARGSWPRSKVSMMIMAAPQSGQT